MCIQRTPYAFPSRTIISFSNFNVCALSMYLQIDMNANDMQAMTKMNILYVYTRNYHRAFIMKIINNTFLNWKLMCRNGRKINLNINRNIPGRFFNIFGLQNNTWIITPKNYLTYANQRVKTKEIAKVIRLLTFSLVSLALLLSAIFWFYK